MQPNCSGLFPFPCGLGILEGLNPAFGIGTVVESRLSSGAGFDPFNAGKPSESARGGRSLSTPLLVEFRNALQSIDAK